MNKEFLKKCWKHPRWHSLMVLIIWIVVLALLMGVVSILNLFSSPKSSVRETKQENNSMSYEEKWEKFENSDYTYTYIITQNEEMIKYEGNVKNDINSGYRERKDGIIRYSIENGIVYEVLMNDKKEIQTLYENVDATLFNPTSIYEIIKTIPVEDTDILEEKEQITYDYNTKLEEENVKIQTIANNNQIKSITIEKINETYKLDFDFKS